MRPSQWLVGTKIGIGFFVAVLSLIMIGSLAFRDTRTLVQATDLRRQTYEVVQGLEAVLSLLKDAETGQRGYIISGEERYLEPYLSAGPRITQEVEKVRKLIAENPAHLKRLDRLQHNIDLKLAEMKDTIELRRRDGFEAAQKVVLSDKGREAMEQARGVIEELKTEEGTTLQRRINEANRYAEATLKTIAYGIPLCVVLICLLGFFIARSIATPLREVTGIAELIARGDLSTEVETTPRRDEVGALRNAFSRMNSSLRGMSERAREMASGDFKSAVAPQSEKDVLGTAFETMTKDLRELIREILEAVNVLASSASEIMASTSQLAASAAQTATAVTETTTTVEEVKQTSQVSSRKGKLVADSAQKASDIAQNGKRSAEKTIENMSGIRVQMESIAERIVRLSEQSQAIGEIIAVVDDLAAQSNLLAVNASIEAAKAGEHGRGFGVVAQEVKSLADQSRQATTQVRGILSEIQKATSAAVMATEQGSKAVEEGVVQSKSAGEAIRLLSESIGQAAEAATQIAATSQEQFVGMDQVAHAMENIKQASTQTVASTRQAENAAQGLHDLGQRLKDLMARFKV
ncbi:MAG: hypothetical protein QOD99_1000 [Chthoniobacter sp.]|jgi:methyl-accepting chemotaxis protein|nr:hypothetical protein [Chthoniobacter sp.]